MRIADKNIVLSADSYDNYVMIDNCDLELMHFADGKARFGGNSQLFILHDPSDEDEERVIKFCRWPFIPRNNRANERFDREIRALRLCAAREKNLVVRYHTSGVLDIGGERRKYIVLEKADRNLHEWLIANQTTVTERLTLIRNITKAILELHELGIYHRDIKHENFLFMNNECKVGDLGLAQFRDDDIRAIDRPDEKIGPCGWLSPEAMNKVLRARHSGTGSFDCTLGKHTDVFALGKLYWYVLQGNLPIGVVSASDFTTPSTDLFELIIAMTQHDQVRRPTLDEVSSRIVDACESYSE